MSVRRDVMLKLVALLCTASVILAVVLAHGSPSIGYELSIYTSTPFPVFALLLLSLVGGIGIVAHELFTRRYEVGRSYLIGFAVILMSAAAFLCLPSIRGYVTSSRSDVLAHIGFLEDILRTGHVGAFNPYPVTHVFLAQIASVTDLSAMQMANLNTVLVFVVFVFTTYLLATAVLPNESQRIMAALVAGGTMAGMSRYYLIPNTWSILMLPLVFYCYFKQQRIHFRILLVLVLVIYPFFHPLSSAVLIVAFAVIELPKPIYWRLLRRLGIDTPTWIGSRPIVWPILLEAAVFTPWVLTRQAFQSNVVSFWVQLSTFSGSHQLQKAGESLAKANVHGLGIPILLLKMYGEPLLFLILAALAGVLLVRQLRRGDRDEGKFRLLLLDVLILLAFLFFAAGFVGLPGTKALATDRLLIYVEVWCVPLVALTLWEMVRQTRFTHLVAVGVSGLLILALLLNILGHFASPYVVRPNDQVTHRDITGMTWYLDEKDPLLPAYSIQTPPERFSQAILGMEATNSRQDLPYVSEVEPHFGYDNFTTLRAQYNEDIYVNINRYDRVTYQTVWRTLGKFNDSDFERLGRDPTVDRIYSNGEMDVLFVGQLMRT